MKVILSNAADVNGTCLQGEINMSFALLVKVLGLPNSKGDGYKVDAEWDGTIDGQVFTIYNYKDGKNYCGDMGEAIEDIKDWHIGGRTREVVVLLTQYITAKLKG